MDAEDDDDDADSDVDDEDDFMRMMLILMIMMMMTMTMIMTMIMTMMMIMMMMMMGEVIMVRQGWPAPLSSQVCPVLETSTCTHGNPKHIKGRWVSNPGQECLNI